jgi:hypothetical protein
MGIRTTLCHIHSAIFEYCIGPGKELEQRKAKGGRKK